MRLRSRCSLFEFDNVVASLLHCFTGRKRRDYSFFFESVSGELDCYRCTKGKEVTGDFTKGVLELKELNETKRDCLGATRKIETHIKSSQNTTQTQQQHLQGPWLLASYQCTRTIACIFLPTNGWQRDGSAAQRSFLVPTMRKIN